MDLRNWRIALILGLAGVLVLVLQLTHRLGPGESAPDRRQDSSVPRGIPKPAQPAAGAPLPPPVNDIAIPEGAAGEALTCWLGIAKRLESRGWGNRFGDYTGETPEILRIIALYRESPNEVGEILRGEYNRIVEVHARAILGLILMTVRGQSEPFLLDRMKATTDPAEKVFLCLTLQVPLDPVPPGTGEAQAKSWATLLLGLAFFEAEAGVMAKSGNDWRGFYGSKSPPQATPGVFDPNRPIFSFADQEAWVCPAWYTSPAAAEVLMPLASAEKHVWIRYLIYMDLQSAANAGNRDVALWMVDQYDREYRPDWNISTGAIVYGALLGLGPLEGTRKVLAWLSERGTEMPHGQRLYLVQAVALTHGDAAWAEVERTYRTLSDATLKEEVLDEYFAFNYKTAPPDAMPLLRQEALAGETWGIRKAAIRAFSTGKYTDVSAFRDALYRGLDDPDWRVRTMAACGVGNLGLREAVPQLVARAKASTAWAEQNWFVGALKKLAPETLDGIRVLPYSTEDPVDAGTSGDSAIEMHK